MNTITDLFQINGKPMLAPDADVEMSFEDLDASDSGRDESGVMHRIVVRHKVGVWNFNYSRLTQEEYAYMLSILPQAGCFTFTYPKPSDSTKRESCTAYLSNYSILWHSAKTGDFRNLKFRSIAC